MLGIFPNLLTPLAEYEVALKSPNPIKKLEETLGVYSRGSWPAFEYLLKLMVYLMHEEELNANNGAQPHHEKIATIFRSIFWPDRYGNKMVYTMNHLNVLLGLVHAYSKEYPEWKRYAAETLISNILFNILNMFFRLFISFLARGGRKSSN